MKTNALKTKGTKLGDWQKIRKGKCQTCGREADLNVDHIVPKYLLEQLGLFDEILNDEENFELVCRTCNTFKGSRINLANPKTIPLFKKYINRL